MKNIVILLLSFFALGSSCQSDAQSQTKIVSSSDEKKGSVGNKNFIPIIDNMGENIANRFNPPVGFERVIVDSNSFSFYLRNLKLKPANHEVKYYNGYTKSKDGVYAAVVDLPIGTKNLHQCADAVMRLKADYHYYKKEFNNIHFNLTNGFRMDYSKWVSGKRLKVEGNNTSWYSGAQVSSDYKSYWKYMEIIFTYAGTLSLSKELKRVALVDMKIGDVFIQGGSPGHAVIVVDMAQHNQTGEKLFMLAQSYMPAQETQILLNPRNSHLGVWYSANIESSIITPEWNFNKENLMRFE